MNIFREYRNIVTGEVAGAAADTAFPALACLMVNFKATASNAGKVYIGKAGVTKPDGTSDTTSGWELDKGQETGFIPVPTGNMNEFHRICDNAGDDVVYIALTA